MMQLPDELVAFHRSGFPLEGNLNHVRLGRYRLWSLDELSEMNKGHGVHEYAPGYVGIGTDGGGEMIALSPLGEVVILPFIGMEPSQAVTVAPSWSALESLIKSAGA